jgi:hypothetical protein
VVPQTAAHTERASGWGTPKKGDEKKNLNKTGVFYFGPTQLSHIKRFQKF